MPGRHVVHRDICKINIYTSDFIVIRSKLREEECLVKWSVGYPTEFFAGSSGFTRADVSVADIARHVRRMANDLA